jgi:hypothetical protein
MAAVVFFSTNLMSFQDPEDEAGAATNLDAVGHASKTFSTRDMQALVDKIEQLKAQSTAFQGTPKCPIDVEAICARAGSHSAHISETMPFATISDFSDRE